MIYPARQVEVHVRAKIPGGLWHWNCSIDSRPLCGANVKADESILSGVRFQPHPSMLAFSICTHHRIIPHIPSPRPRARLAQDQEAVHDPRGTHPPLHTREAPIAAAAEAVAPLQHADAAFTAVAPFEPGSNGARAAFPALRRQDDGSPVACVRGPLACATRIREFPQA